MDETPDGFITLPPGIADSGTLKRDRAEPPALVERDEITFFPAAPGIAVAARWRLTFDSADEDSADEVIVDHVLFLGRDPVATAAHAGAPVLALNDETKSVSKTHAMVEVVGGVLRIHDLDSTNGVWVSAPGSDPVEVVPGEPVVVASGSRVELGDFALRVTHS